MRRIVVLVTAVCSLSSCLNSSHTVKVQLINTNGKEVASDIEHNLATLLTEFNVADSDNLELSFVDVDMVKDASEQINSVRNNGRLVCEKNNLKLNLLDMPNGGFQVRQIPLIISSGPSKFRKQEAVINFTSDGLIESLNISIGQREFESTMCDALTLNELRRKLLIVKFVENIQTSFVRKDIRMAQNIFSDGIGSASGYRKAEFIKNLEGFLDRDGFVDVDIFGLDVLKHGMREDIYGVSFYQHLGIDTFLFKGRVFFIFEFGEGGDPIIQFAVWQPMNLDSVLFVELSDFDIVK